jgi:uncharacterized membrane protein YkvA (DUF1232 family)
MFNFRGMKNIKKLMVILLGIICFLYLLNPAAGLFEIIPDNIPFIGNIDEGLVAYLLFSCIQYLRGKEIGIFDKKKNLIQKIGTLKTKEIQN